MDAQGEGMCAMYMGLAWDGSNCIGISGCSCVGADCDELYDSPDECQADHADC